MAAVFAAVVNGATATSATTADYTKTGFGTPKAAIVLCARTDSYDTAVANGALSIGFWDSTNQVCYSCFAEGSGGFTDTTDFGYNNKIIAMDNVDSALLFTGTVANITDGIRITYAGTGTWAAYKVTVILFNGSDLQAKAGALALGTGTSPIEVSCGFQPDLILATSAGSNDGTHRSLYMYPSFGCAKDAGGGTTTHRCSMMFEDVATTVYTTVVVRTDCLVDKSASGGRAWYLTASGWDSNGLDVTPSASTASSYMMYLALDVGSASTWLGTVNPPTTASGAWDSPNTGFTPQLVILGQTLADSIDVIESSSPPSDTFGICAFDDATEGSIAITEDDSHSDAAAKSYASERLAYLYDGYYTSPTLYYDIGNATMDSTGWTVADDEVDTADATTRYWWGLALEQGSTATNCSIAQTLPKLSQSATADVDVSASAAQTLVKLSQSATADVDVSASAAQTLPTISQSATASTGTIASAAQTLPKLSQAATADVDVSASAAQTLVKLSQAATGKVQATGFSVQTLPKLSQSATGKVQATGFSVQTLPKLSQSATGKVQATGFAVQTLPRLTQSVDAALRVAAEINQSLPGVVQNAVASSSELLPLNASISQTLPSFGMRQYNLDRIFQVPACQSTFQVPVRAATFVVDHQDRTFTVS